MRRTAAVVLACLLLGGAAACGGGDDKPAAKQAAASPSISKESRYLAVANGITFNGTPATDELLALPPRWCQALDAGHGVEWMLGDGGLYPVGEEWGTVKTDAYTLMVAGVEGYCPKHLAAVRDELKAAGAY